MDCRLFITAQIYKQSNKTGSAKPVIYILFLSFFFCFLPGKTFAATRFSVAAGNWNSTSTWSATSGGGSGASVPAAGDDVTIEGGWTVTVNANTAALTSLTISSGSTLSVSGAFTVSSTTITVNGSYTNASTGARTCSNWVVGATGIYNHNTTALPFPIGSVSSTWDAASNFNINGFTGAALPTNFIGQSFGNVTYNCTGQTSTVDLVPANGTATIKGNFNILSTNTGVLHLRLSSVVFSPTITINGNFSISGGTLDMNNAGGGTNAVIINIGGNFNQSGGTITETTSQTGETTTINFNKAGIQTFTKTGGTISSTTTAGPAILFNVVSGAVLDMGTNVLNGTNPKFTLSSGAGIITAHSQGISTTSATGCIQVTGAKTYSTGANYTYNGIVNQATGNSLPTGLTGKLTINNSGSAGSNTVTLTSAEAVANTGSIDLNAGVFAAGTNLTMNAAASAINRSEGSMTGTIQGAGPSTYNVSYSGNTKTSGPELSGGGLNNITANLTSGQTLTLDQNRAPDGNVTITAEVFDLSTFTLNRSAAGGTLTVAGTLVLGGTTGGQTGSNFPSNFSTLTMTGGTVNYNTAAGGQTVYSTPVYNVLTMGNTSGTQTAGGNISTTTLNNNTNSSDILNMAANTLTVTTPNNTGTIRTQNTSGTPISSGLSWGGNITYDGAGSQTISANTFNNFTINNSAGATMSGDVTVNGTLSFTSGKITTGANKVIVGIAGTVTGAAAGQYVYGNLRRYVPNTTAPTIGYDIGDASNYTPVSIIFAGTVSGSGYLDASTAAYVPPVASGLSQTKYINRKWTLTNTGVGGFSSYSSTFTFTAGDKVGSPNTSALVIRKWNGSIWSHTTTGSQLALSTQCTGLTTFSDFADGEDACSDSYLWLGSTDTDWNTGSNWCSGAVPSSSDNVTIPSAPSNQPIIGVAGGLCNNITINAGAVLTISSSNNLAVYGNWSNSGTFTANTSTVNFRGSYAQTINGATTFSTLKANNTAGVTLGAAAAVTALNIGDEVSGSLFNDGGFQISSTGTLTLASGTLKLGSGAAANTYPAFSTSTIASGTTVDYGSSSAQTAAAVNYGNLTNTGNGNRTLASSGTIGIASTFTPGSGTFTITGSTVNFNGTGAQTVNAFTYNNLTISGARTGSNNVTLASGGTIDIAGIYSTTATFGTGGYVNTGSSLNFSGVNGQTIPAFNYNNLSSSNNNRVLAASGTVGVAGTFTPGSGTYTVSGSTVSFNGTGAQTVNAFTYNNLTINSTRTGSNNVTLAASGTIDVAGTFSPVTTFGSGGYINTGSTINFSGANGQIIPAFNYNNLSSSNNNRVLASSGTVGIAGTFTPNAGAYTITGSTVSFNGTGAQTVNAFTYNNLTINSTRTGSNNVTLASSGTIDIAGVFSPITTFGSGGYVNTGSTVNYSGANGQTISAFNYNNLSSSNNNRVLAPSGTIGIAGTFTTGSGTYTITGSTVDFNGTAAQTINGITYNNLTISGSGTNSKTSSADITVNGILNLSSANASSTQGTLHMGTDTLHMGSLSTTTGTGDVTGIVKRAHAFVTNTFYSIGNVNQGFLFPAVTGQTFPTYVTGRLHIGTAPVWGAGGADNPPHVTKRFYEMIHGGGSGTRALFRMHYLDSELADSVNENTLSLWSYYVPGAVRTDGGQSNFDPINNFFTKSDIDFAAIPSGALSDFQMTIAPSSATYLTWNGSVSTNWNYASNWTPNGIPSSSYGVIIPSADSTTYDPELPMSDSTQASCAYIIIEANGVLNAGTNAALNITLGTVANEWACESGGTFNAGSSTVFFNTSGSDFASISGSTNFNNVTVSSGSKLRIATNAYIGIAGTLDNLGTLAAATNENTIEYNGSGPQSIIEPNGSTPGYKDLTLSGAGNKTNSGTIHIVGDFENNCSGSVTAGNFVWNPEGFETDWEEIKGSTATTFTNLTVNTNVGLLLGGSVDASVTDTLKFISGIIATNANHLIVGRNSPCSSGIVSGAGAGKYVYGNLRRYVPNASGPTVVYDIGDSANYTPVSIGFAGTTTGCGYLEASTAVSKPSVASGLSQTKYINRKWSLTNSGVGGFSTYSSTFTFTAGDKVGSPDTAALIIRKWNGSSWASTTAGTRTSVSTQCTGLTSFSDFYIGEDVCTSGTSVWLGGSSTDWNTGSNWCSGSVPGPTDNVVISAGASNQPTIGAAGGVCNNITIDSGAVLTMGGAYNLVVSGSWTNSGTFTSSTSTVNFKSYSAQTINGATTFSTLKVNNKAGVTLASAVTAASLTIGNDTAHSIFNDGGYQVTGGSGTLTLTDSSTFKVGNAASAAAFPAFAANTISAGTTVDYGSSSAQTIAAVNYGNLTNTGNGDRTLASSGTIGISGSFTTGTGEYTITGSTVNFNAAATQTINGITYNNLTISGSGANSKRAGGDITVTGILNLSSANASSTKGALDMGYEPDPEYILYMGASSTTAGTGDVSGYVNRSSFALSTDYTFGNQYTKMNFTAGPLPVSVTVEIYLTSSEPSWMTATKGIYRYYDVTRSGGSPATRLRFNIHYLDSELHGASEDSLDLFDYHASISAVHDHGRTDNDTVNNWVGFENVGLAFLGVASPDDHLWTLGNQISGDTSTWIGGSPSGPTDWELPGNWEGGVPRSVSYVIIPGGRPAYPILPDGKTINTIDIKNGGVVNATTGSPTLTIGHGPNAWQNLGILNAGTSTVVFTNAAAAMAGTTDFYNVTVNDGAALYPAENNIMRIAGTLSLSSTGVLHAATDTNTVEYNGTGQTVILPNGVPSGYWNLILSGSAAKTMPSSAMNLYGSFTMSGTASAEALNVLNTAGNFSIGSGNSFTTGAFRDSIGGNFSINSGTFSAAGSTIVMNGTSAQSISGVPVSFNNLTLSNTSAVVSANNDISVNGTLTLHASSTLDMGTNALSGSLSAVSGSGTLKTQNTSSAPIPSGKTWPGNVFYNSSSAQTIVSDKYNNLNGSGGARTLSSTDTVGIAGTFTVGDGAYTITGSTVDFNGTAAQSIPAFNFFNLRISGNKGGGAVTLVNGGTIGVSAIFSVTAINTSYIVTGNTFDYNGTAAQTVKTFFNYNYLVISNTGIKTILTGTTVYCQKIYLNDSAKIKIEGTSQLKVLG